MSKETLWVATPQDEKRKEILRAFDEDKKVKGLSITTKDILINRGITTVEEVHEIFETDIIKQHNPFLMKDMDKTVEYLERFLQEDKHIVIYGDYDSDGACATAIAVLCLRELGAKVDYFINNRFIHGYGMTVDGVKDLIKRYPTTDVIVTVDNGIVAFEGIDYAVKEGIDVIVTDHHEALPDGSLPNALTVVDPKRLDETYPFKEICGAALIYKVMLSLYLYMKKPLDYVYSMVDIVGMATIGDVMPLRDENRLFVKESIKQINKNPRPAFKVLKEKIGKSTIDEGTFGFQFVPMVNAIGRLNGTIDEAVELFLATDMEEVEKYADFLIETNEKRKEITKTQEEIAVEMVESRGVESVIVLANEDFHEGIVGLIAGRLKEKYNRPTIVLTKTKSGLWKGSGRSIEAFSLIDNLHLIKDTLNHFGGHDMACGVGLREDQVDLFRQAMIERADTSLTEEDFIPKVIVDVYIDSSDVTEELVEELEDLKPFGTKFESPNIAVKDFEVERTFTMGKDKNHLKLINNDLSMIMWSGVPFYRNLGQPNKIQAIGMPSLNYWNGQTSIQLIVQGELLKRS